MVKLVGLLRRFGNTARRFGWNYEFQRGAWFAGERSQAILRQVETYGVGMRIVELGCGDGSLARRVQHVPHHSYFGLDISDKAIEAAREIADSRYRFASGSFEGWQPSEPFDLLIMEECLYYLSVRKQKKLLERASATMPIGSVAVFAFFDAEKHQKTLDCVRQQGRILYDDTEGTRSFIAIEMGSYRA